MENVQRQFQTQPAEKNRFGISKSCEICGSDAVTEVQVESDQMIRIQRFCDACLAKEGY